MTGDGADENDARNTCDDGQDPFDEVVLPVEEHLDLHPFRPRDVRSVVEAYLEAAAERGLREVRVIHGRGIGMQRDSVRRLLRRHPQVEAFADAPPERGGWGATIVRLRPAATPGTGGAGGGD